MTSCKLSNSLNLGLINVRSIKVCLLSNIVHVSYRSESLSVSPRNMLYRLQFQKKKFHSNYQKIGYGHGWVKKLKMIADGVHYASTYLEKGISFHLGKGCL